MPYGIIYALGYEMVSELIIFSLFGRTEYRRKVYPYDIAFTS